MSDQKVAVIAPDLGSALLFDQVLRQNNLKTELFSAKIAPRVEGTRLTDNISYVVNDMRLVFQALAQDSGVSKITIACNTLSLPVFIDPILKEFPDLREKIILSPSTIKKAMLYDNQTIILGTKPFILEIQKLSMGGDKIAKTFYDYSREAESELNLVQEIIWRVKAIQGSDVSTCLSSYEQIFNTEILIERIGLLKKILDNIGVSRVILACTELPFAFELMKKNFSDNFKIIDPADLIAQDIIN